MLALTHHVIVQVAARRVGHKRFFDLYAVLGDDIVIADKAVADAYLVLMDDLGVDINLSKSLTSDVGVLEFAKRLIIESQDVSPIPPKLLVALSHNFKILPTIIRDMIGRGLSIESLKLQDQPRVSRSIL